MIDHAARRLPVIDGHDVIGVLSQAGVARGAPADAVADLVRSISDAAANTGSS